MTSQCLRLWIQNHLRLPFPSTTCTAAAASTTSTTSWTVAAAAAATALATVTTAISVVHNHNNHSLPHDSGDYYEKQRIMLMKYSSAFSSLYPSSLFSVSKTMLEGDDFVTPPAYPWRHRGFFSSYDCAALRRGFQVYREVCASCHSIDRLRWRELAGVTHTTQDVKEMAKQVDVVDGPNMQGEMFERPAKPYDRLPKPYPNNEAARAANGGALPPDLSLLVKARHEGHDYIMALLMGYMDPPAGKIMMDGVYYNPYFPGGLIAMPPPLHDEGVEYEDGTVATIAQQARDVTQFLNWAAEPEMEDRKKNGTLYTLCTILLILGSGYMKRWKWSPHKTRKIAYVKGIA